MPAASTALKAKADQTGQPASWARPWNRRDPGDLPGTNVSALTRPGITAAAAAASSAEQISASQVSAHVAMLSRLTNVRYAVKETRIRLLQSAVCSTGELPVAA